MFIRYRFNRVRSGKSNFQSRHFIVVKKQGKPELNLSTEYGYPACNLNLPAQTN